MDDPLLKDFSNTQSRYFTCWTFAIQVFYALIGLTCDILTLLNSGKKDYKLPKHLRGCRDTLFAGVLWPSTLQLISNKLFDLIHCGGVYLKFLLLSLHYDIIIGATGMVAESEILNPAISRTSSDSEKTATSSPESFHWELIPEIRLFREELCRVRKELKDFRRDMVELRESLVMSNKRMDEMESRISILEQKTQSNSFESSVLEYYNSTTLQHCTMAGRRNLEKTKPEDAVKTLEKKFEECMSSFQARLESSQPNITSLTNDFIMFKETMKTALEILKKQVQSLTLLTDDIDNRSRRKFLLIRGIEESDTENCIDTVVNLLVCTVFWSLFLYDRDLILPEVFDKVLSWTSNHVIHTAIVPVVLWEVVFRPRSEPKSHLRNVLHVLFHIFLYFLVLTYTYIERGIWIYPILTKTFATIVMHVSNIYFMIKGIKKEHYDDPYLKGFRNLQSRYFTCWTFVIQIFYALIGLTCDILTLLNSGKKDYKLPKHLRGCRDTLFAGVLWPSTLLVSTVFWSLFLYDRDLILPKAIDKVLSKTSNHVIHTAIVPVVLWEVVFRPRTEPKSHLRNMLHVLFHISLYFLVLAYTYRERGIWIYPIFTKTFGTIYFPIILAILLSLKIFFYFLQWQLNYLLHGRKMISKKTL
ncbi:unnamed protein product [Parnassius apollo]|uniref:(apollo) hypothetical protein n=1 Tax=Parnassius apollo TaxID=110799 RepID=A0A8S3WGP0_PARAO|nr:unnamed protein product [Parnassius apollo]